MPREGDVRRAQAGQSCAVRAPAKACQSEA